MTNIPSVTREQIDALRAKLVYTYTVPEGTTTTFCHAYLPGKEGHQFHIATGMSACVSPLKYNAEIGRQMALSKAMENANDKLWELEGWVLFKELENA